MDQLATWKGLRRVALHVTVAYTKYLAFSLSTGLCIRPRAFTSFTFFKSTLCAFMAASVMSFLTQHSQCMVGGFPFNQAFGYFDLADALVTH